MSIPYYLKLLTPPNSKPLKLHTFTCERCGKKFELPFWYIKKGRRFCSHACRMEDPLKKLMRMHIKKKDGCWDFTGVIGWGGYGQMTVKKKNWSAHKLMWILHNKKIVPPGMVVRHTCIGNPRCINPDHLILGTQKENIHDIIRQGRFRSAFGTPVRKFSPEIVKEIRGLRKHSTDGSRLKPTYKEIAKKYGTTDGAIWALVNFVTYKDIK